MRKTYSLMPFSLQDAPGPCTIVFAHGCNLRCDYCYNTALFEQNGHLFSSLKYYINNSVFGYNKQTHKQFNKVEYIIFSGGECLDLGPIALFRFILLIKHYRKQGFKIGVYTNGTRLWQLKIILKYLDFINLDYKFLFKHYNIKKAIQFVHKRFLKSNLIVRYNTTMFPDYHTEIVMRRMQLDIASLVGYVPHRNLAIECSPSIREQWLWTPAILKDTAIKNAAEYSAADILNLLRLVK
jgi:pyruvate-formate lyase-activating enzyme